MRVFFFFNVIGSNHASPIENPPRIRGFWLVRGGFSMDVCSLLLSYNAFGNVKNQIWLSCSDGAFFLRLSFTLWTDLSLLYIMTFLSLS